MKKKLKRGVSLFIAMLMVITMMPVRVLAEDLNTLNAEIVNQVSMEVDSPTVLTDSSETANPAQVMEIFEKEDYLSQEESVEAINEPENWLESELDGQKTQTGTEQITSSYNNTLKVEIDQTLEATQSLQTSAVENGFEYIDYNDGVSITHYTGAGGNVIVPETLGGKKVLMIGVGAFYNNGDLQSISLPSGVTTIESSAFAGCTSLTSMVIPNAVTAISEGTFASCESLTDITLPDSLTTIGRYSFQLCTSLTGIALPDTVISIGEAAFNECSKITDITLPNSVTTIESSAFAGCTSLTSMVIPNAVTAISEGTFASCTSLTDIALPNSVTTIESSAFAGCTSLTSMVIPN